MKNPFILGIFALTMALNFDASAATEILYGFDQNYCSAQGGYAGGQNSDGSGLILLDPGAHYWGPDGNCYVHVSVNCADGYAWDLGVKRTGDSFCPPKPQAGTVGGVNTRAE